MPEQAKSRILRPGQAAEDANGLTAKILRIHPVCGILPLSAAVLIAVDLRAVAKAMAAPTTSGQIKQKSKRKQKKKPGNENEKTKTPQNETKK